jgi:hypothetical protein
MRTQTVAVALVIFCGALPAAQESGIDRVAWLQGCWEMVSPQRTIEEQWMAPRAGSMVGVSRTVRGDSLVEYEMMVLRDQGGRLTYEAHPSGQSVAVFESSMLEGSSVVFENLDHDFPQRIGYQRNGSNVLFAWIEGTDKGQSRHIDFLYRRVACGGP